MIDNHIYSPEWGDGSPCSVCMLLKPDHMFKSTEYVKDKQLGYLKEHFPNVYYDILWATATEEIS